MARYKFTLQTNKPKFNLPIIAAVLAALCLGGMSVSSAAPASAEGVQDAGQAQYAPTSVVFSTAPGSYGGLWIGEMSGGGNVRSGPSVQRPRIKSWGAGRRVLLYEGVTDASGGLWYRVSETPEQPMYVHSSLVRRLAAVKFEPGKFMGKWVNVNLSQQVVTAYDGSTPLRVTLASTGTRLHPTEVGVWKIFYKLLKQDMDGGSKEKGDYYNLKDVPYPQYFHTSGEGLHGTYWHDDFGRPHSHGCVNLSIPMAEWFYKWDNIGTTVWSHY
ncbi:MAG: hypothetical protein QOH93_355 [Chloroflexia bacterium]|jgi:hypothetical protein|nr:hypothetical protein [Chloroflexia bacterium]